MWSETFANDSTKGKFINQNQESTKIKLIHIFSYILFFIRFRKMETSIRKAYDLFQNLNEILRNSRGNFLRSL